MEEFLTGPVPEGWKVTTLGDVAEQGEGHIQTGPFGSQLHASDDVPVGIPSIMPVNIGKNGIIEEGIARITDYLGHPAVRAWIVQHAVGATMPNLNTSIMKAVPLLVLPRKEQEAVVSVLGALDDKIELNRRMNQTLEEMAQAIFKSWLVDFDPVRAKAAGRQPTGVAPHIADLFPDTFEESELGRIPNGWRVGHLGDVAVNHRRSISPEEINPATPFWRAARA